MKSKKPVSAEKKAEVQSASSPCTPDRNADSEISVVQEEPHLVIPLSKKLFRRILLIIAFAIGLAWAFAHPQNLTSIIGSTLSLLAPFLIGLCMAFVVNMLLSPLEKLWDTIWKKSKTHAEEKWKRPVCFMLSILLILGAVFVILFMIIPELKSTFKLLAAMMPTYLSNFEKMLENINSWLLHYNIVIPELAFDLEKAIEFVQSYLLDYINSAIDKTVDITASIFSVIVNIVLAAVFSIYLLAQKEKLLRWSKKITYALFRKETADRMVDFARLTDETFTHFVTGQLTEAVIIGVLCFIGMSIFKMPYAMVISVLVGVTALIPVIGAFIGTIFGAFLILLVEPLKALWFIIFIIVLQQLEGNLIYPRVVGKSIGLPGILVLSAVTIGGSLFGIPGILFGVPICSVAYTVFRAFVEKRLKERKLSEKEF